MQVSQAFATSAPYSTMSRGTSMPVRSLIMSGGDACQKRSCSSCKSSARSLSSLAWINFYRNSRKSSAGRCRVIVRPCIWILSSEMSRAGCSAVLSETSVFLETALSPGGSGTIACDGRCGTFVFCRIRRLTSLWMSLPSAVIFPNSEMLTETSFIHLCLCSSVCDW